MDDVPRERASPPALHAVATKGKMPGARTKGWSENRVWGQNGGPVGASGVFALQLVGASREIARLYDGARQGVLLLQRVDQTLRLHINDHLELRRKLSESQYRISHVLIVEMSQADRLPITRPLS